MPAPIMPAPRTPIFSALVGSMPSGRDLPALIAPRSKKNACVMFLNCWPTMQLDEVARLDAGRGLEVDLRALDRGAHDVARGLVERALGLLAQVGGERRQERRELGVGRQAARACGSPCGPTAGSRPPRCRRSPRSRPWPPGAARPGSRRPRRRGPRPAPWTDCICVPCEQELHQRIGDAEHADGARDAAATGQQAEGRLGQADLVAAVDRDAVVGRERDLEAATERGAVDRRDDGLAVVSSLRSVALMPSTSSNSRWASAGRGLGHAA